MGNTDLHVVRPRSIGSFNPISSEPRCNTSKTILMHRHAQGSFIAVKGVAPQDAIGKIVDGQIVVLNP